MTLKDRFRKDCRKSGLFDAGDTVLAGVSGGADSVSLFLLLTDLKEEYALDLHVICVDHGLRMEAAEEIEYVRKLSEQYGAVFHTAKVDVSAYASEKHLSTEEAARELRYQAFSECAAAIGCGKSEKAAKTDEPFGSSVKIAVAHTRDDQAETILYRLFRGTGIKGMAGMRLQSGRLIRPLIGYSRAEIEEELDRRGVSFYTDASNESDDYARNCIRHHILPEAARINAQAAAHIAAAAGQIAEAEDYVESQISDAYKNCVTEMPEGNVGEADMSSDDKRPNITAGKSEGITGLQIRREAFLSLHPYLQERVLLLAMECLCGSARDISSVHITDLKSLFTLPTGKRLDLPYRMTAARRREYVELYAPEKAPFYKKGVSEKL